MKDYTINNEDKKMFILSYKVKKDNIIVKLASNEKYIIPYTEENEGKILDRMREQITENVDFERRSIKEYILLLLLTIALGVGTLIISAKFLPNLITHPSIKTILANIPTFGAAAITAISGIFTISTAEILKDFRKNKLYLEKEEELNDKVKENQNILSNVSNKTRKMVESTPEDKEVFDINKMNKVSLQDLKQLLENIKRDEEFDFDYEPKKLIRTRDE